MTEEKARLSMDKRLRSLLRSGATPEDAAAAVVKKATRADLEALMASWALHRARHISRRLVVHAERAVEAAGSTVAVAVAAGAPQVRGIMAYVDGHGLVAWDQMTADQHDARAAMQRRLAGECIQDAERHEEAARMIREAGVTCLAEIGTATPAALPNEQPRSRTSRRRQAIAA